MPYAIAAYACIGVTVLGKGPVGMLLPLAAMGLFLLAINGWRSLFRSAWWMRPFTMIVVIAAVAVPWYVAVGYQTDWEWPKQFFLDFNLRPFRKPILGHGDASSLDRALAALVSILVLLLLYSRHSRRLLPLVGVPGADAGRCRSTTEGRKKGKGKKGKQETEAARWRAGVVLALCWFGTWFVLWSLVKTKLPHYLLPAYPALALLTACFIDRWLAAEKKGSDPICREAARTGASHKRGLSPFPPPGRCETPGFP